MLPDRLRAAVDTIYEAGYDRAHWQAGLAQLCAAIGSRNALTVPRVAAEETLHLPYSEGLEDFAQEFVAGGWYLRDLRAQRGWPLTDRGQKIVLEQDITTEDDHRREPMYQELLRPHGQWRWAGITFRTPDRQYVLSTFRPPSGTPFTETERALFLELSGHLARAVTIAERLGAEHALSGKHTLEALGEAAIFLDGAGRIIDMTLRAESLLGDGVTAVQRQLVATRPADQRAIEARIAQAIAEGPGSEGPLHIARPGRRPLLLDVLPAPTRFDGPFLFARLILLLIDLDEKPLPAAAVLSAVFGLTPAEVGLAQDLAAGLTLAEAADKRGIARETARTHLKALFHKTDTNRQSALISMLHSVSRRYPASR